MNLPKEFNEIVKGLIEILPEVIKEESDNITLDDVISHINGGDLDHRIQNFVEILEKASENEDQYRDSIDDLTIDKVELEKRVKSNRSEILSLKEKILSQHKEMERMSVNYSNNIDDTYKKVYEIEKQLTKLKEEYFKILLR